jgi:hypothetical protein
MTLDLRSGHGATLIHAPIKRHSEPMYSALAFALF